MGLNPVEKPCSSRKSKNPPTVWKMGYKNPHTKHTNDPKAITGTRPIVSVSLPLNGLDNKAVAVNKLMINPL